METGISSGLMGHLARMQTLPFFFFIPWYVHHVHTVRKDKCLVGYSMVLYQEEAQPNLYNLYNSMMLWNLQILYAICWWPLLLPFDLLVTFKILGEGNRATGEI